MFGLTDGAHVLGFGEGYYEDMVIAEGWHCMLGDGSRGGEELCGARFSWSWTP